MGITTFIDEDSITLVQGVDGIKLCNEDWMTDCKKEK